MCRSECFSQCYPEILHNYVLQSKGGRKKSDVGGGNDDEQEAAAPEQQTNKGKKQASVIYTSKTDNVL